MGALSWIIMVVISATFMQICRAVDDKLLSLPGQPRVSFQQYAGYVTVDENQDRALFYYFVEAESDPASKPLVLWLNGGPGCSSVGAGAGAFSENGPFRPSGGESLVRKDYKWSREANVMYLESPAGVGFFYSANQSFYNLENDTITAQDNFVFLQNWFLKFPEYKNRDLFITGESYAGVDLELCSLVPQLAYLIVKSGLKFNLKGVALGNPLLEFSTDFNSEGDFYWSHGLISNPTYELLSAVCNTSQLWRERLGASLSASCLEVVDQLNAEIPDVIDTYYVTGNVCLSSGESETLLGVHNHPLSPRFQSFSSDQSLHDALS
ncbi:serine carboxypeptidase-like 46 [Populus alba]|uniref:serine carboxypeptidase-like 46 n=1 Tax=Populus alba TaxID=43335 RepID=UPI0015899832|nr:serine carboxypeptidase-like 45 [Populus alba]